jgi:NifU-like protein
MSVYPKKINERFKSPTYAVAVRKANAKGTGASFVCGISVKISFRIDDQTKEIKNAGFKTNGCGYVIATADFLCEKILGEKLTDLHGLDGSESDLRGEFGELPDCRRHCAEACFDAIQNALAEYRTARIEEWTGEKALICTCFGVSEERLEKEIGLKKLETVEDVGEVCHAGTGCGSCQPLIQEILDSRDFEEM